MATRENLEELQKEKVAETKDVKNAEEVGESITTKEAAVIEKVVLEETNKKNEAETKDIVAESKGKEADQAEKKKDEAQEADASNVEKSLSMTTEEMREDVQKDKGLVEKVVKEEEKKNEAEPMQNKGKEVDQIEKKKDDEVENVDASEVEKSSSMVTEEKGVVEKVLKEEKQPIEAEPKDIVVQNQGKEFDQIEKKKKKKKDEVEKANASTATKEKLEETQKDKGIVEEVVKEENKKIEADQTEKKKAEVDKTDGSKVEQSSSMVTEEKLNDAPKDKGVVEKVVKEETKSEAEPTESMEKINGKDSDQIEKKKEEVEKVDASKVEKSSSTATEEKLEDVQKDKGAEEKVVKEQKNIETEPKLDDVQKDKGAEEKVVKEENKNIETEPRETAVQKKEKEVDQTEMKKDEVEKVDASKDEKISSIEKEEKLDDALKDKGVVKVVKEEKKTEAEPPESVEKKKGKDTDENEKKKEEVHTDKGVVEEVVKKEKKIEVEPRDIVVDDSLKAESLEELSLEEKNKIPEVENRSASESEVVEKCSSLRGERNSISDLKENEKQALEELRSKIEKAIHENNLLRENEKEKEASENVSEMKSETKENEGEIVVDETKKEEETSKEVEDAASANSNKQEDEEKEKKAEQETTKKDVLKVVHFNINKDIAIWGVPLLPSKENNAVDVIILKFLRAKQFDVDDAFEMLRNTLQWRKDNSIDSILNENFGDDIGSLSSIDGFGREGHPICYNIFKPLDNDEFYKKIFGTEEMCNKFIMSKVQLLERAIQKLDFKLGVSSIFIVNDLKDLPGPSKKDFRNALRQALAILQNNYPEFVARNMFINVPFWYYAFSASALLSPFLTPKGNINVFARPSKVNDVLLKYITLEELPAQYGGLRKENDLDFSTKDVASEIFVNRSSTETIHIPAPEAGMTTMWEVLVVGWEVNYKEEFMPTDDASNGLVIQSKKVGAQECSIRNSFRNEDPGDIVLTIENGALLKKKRIFYRYKIKTYI